MAVFVVPPVNIALPQSLIGARTQQPRCAVAGDVRAPLAQALQPALATLEFALFGAWLRPERSRFACQIPPRTEPNSLSFPARPQSSCVRAITRRSEVQILPAQPRPRGNTGVFLGAGATSSRAWMRRALS